MNPRFSREIKLITNYKWIFIAYCKLETRNDLEPIPFM